MEQPAPPPGISGPGMILCIHSQRSPQHINWLNVGDTQSELNNV